MFDTSNAPAGYDDRTQAFSLSNPDATLPRIDIPNNQEGLAELTIVRGPSAGERLAILLYSNR